MARRRPDGGVYFTLTGPGKSFYVSPQGQAQTVASDVQTPNGLILSPDERTLYVSEYVPKRILSFKVSKNGGLSGRGSSLPKWTMVNPSSRGRWNVCGPGRERLLRGPNHIWIWDSSGKLLDKIVCPERAVDCAFGGTQLLICI